MLAPWKKSYDKPREHTKKQRHYFADKGPSSQSYYFPVVMCGCENWTIKTPEHWRTDAFELWCWRRLLRVPWTERRSNQSFLKEINPEYSLEVLILKLKLQYFGYLMQRAGFCSFSNETLMLGKIEGRRRRGQQRMRWLDGITDLMDMNLSTVSVGDGQGRLACCNPWGCKASDPTKRLNLPPSLHQPVSARVLLRGLIKLPDRPWYVMTLRFNWVLHPPLPARWHLISLACLQQRILPSQFSQNPPYPWCIPLLILHLFTSTLLLGLNSHLSVCLELSPVPLPYCTAPTAVVLMPVTIVYTC